MFLGTQYTHWGRYFIQFPRNYLLQKWTKLAQLPKFDPEVKICHFNLKKKSGKLYWMLALVWYINYTKHWLTESFYRKDSLHANLHDLHPGGFGLYFHNHRIGTETIQWNLEENARITGTNPSTDQIGCHSQTGNL